MIIVKTAADEFRMTLAPSEARIFINCMNETIKQIGGWEYATRMDAKIDQIKAVVSALEAALI